MKPSDTTQPPQAQESDADQVRQAADRRSTQQTGRQPARPLLRVSQLRTWFPVVARSGRARTSWLRAVDGVSFDIDPGTTLGLVGESGCGKTTLGRSILRLVEPTAGAIEFDGVAFRSLRAGALRRARRQIQMVFQDPVGSLNPKMRVASIVAEPLTVHGLARGKALRSAIGALLEQVGLSADDMNKHPHEFSGGQRQRIGIARAIALKPKLIVCDEPVSALDVSVQAQILNLLAALRASLGLSYLFIAHDLAVVRHFCDEVAVMYLGKIVEQAPVDQLFRDPRHPYTQMLLASIPNPDPTSRNDFRPPVGEPPDPAEPPAGCAFHPRCPIATERCRLALPALEQRPTTPAPHLVACHHAEPEPPSPAPQP